MIFAGQRTIDQVSDGRRVTDIIQDNDKWNVLSATVPVNLISQIRKVQLEVLRDKSKTKCKAIQLQTSQCFLESVISRLHLAGLLVHVEGGDEARAGLTAAPLQQVLSQPGGEIGLPCAAGARQDQPSVLQKQTDVVLHHGLGNERLKYQTVHTLLLKTWNRE